MYIDLADYCFAYNAKVGISSFARAIITKYFPEHESYVKQLLDENIENHHRHLYFNLVKKVATAYKPVILMVRNPIDRFISAMNYLQVENIEDALNALENKNKIKIPICSKPIYLYQDVHFRKQITYLSHENYLFRFPEHINEAAQLINIQSIPKLNSSRTLKKELNENQKNRILQYYQKDLQLYQSINHPKTIILSKIKIELDDILKKHFTNTSIITDDAINAIKQFVNKYPYVKKMIVNDLMKKISKL